MADRMSETGRLESVANYRHPRRSILRTGSAPRPEDGFDDPIVLATGQPSEYHPTGSIRSFRRLTDMSFLNRQCGGP